MMTIKKRVQNAKEKVELLNVIFSPTTDYAAIEALLKEPRSWRRMTGDAGPRQMVDIGPRDGLEYVLAMENETPIAVFVILQGIELHFCMSPDVWGRTLEIAEGFLNWLWQTTDIALLVGPVPKRNRLALSLALRAGFKPHHEDNGLVYTYLEKPVAA